MDMHNWWVTLARIGSSLLGAGTFYSLWLASVLLTVHVKNDILGFLLSLLAPIVTATGFTIGVMVFNRLVDTRHTSFVSIFLWPLVGCAAGAGIVYWFGPMLIVFGMFIAGTASIVMMEVFVFSGK